MSHEKYSEHIPDIPSEQPPANETSPRGEAMATPFIGRVVAQAGAKPKAGSDETPPPVEPPPTAEGYAEEPADDRSRYRRELQTHGPDAALFDRQFEPSSAGPSETAAAASRVARLGTDLYAKYAAFIDVTSVEVTGEGQPIRENSLVLTHQGQGASATLELSSEGVIDVAIQPPSVVHETMIMGERIVIEDKPDAREYEYIIESTGVRGTDLMHDDVTVVDARHAALLEALGDVVRPPAYSAEDVFTAAAEATAPAPEVPFDADDPVPAEVLERRDAADMFLAMAAVYGNRTQTRDDMSETAADVFGSTDIESRISDEADDAYASLKLEQVRPATAAEIAAADDSRLSDDDFIALRRKIVVDVDAAKLRDAGFSSDRVGAAITSYLIEDVVLPESENRLEQVVPLLARPITLNPSFVTRLRGFLLRPDETTPAGILPGNEI
jgi:hypothetical protein